MERQIRFTNPEDDFHYYKEEIGSGGMSLIFKARNLQTDQIVARKMTRPELVERMWDEVEMLRNFNHPNIPAYVASFYWDAFVQLFIELCEGGSLMDIVQKTGPLSELQIAFVCRETLKALDYVHKKGIAHRDVKAGNILLTESGEVKLSDFGLAAQLDFARGNCTVTGTPHWMAPEVSVSHMCGGGYNHLCDLWSLGITAIELAEVFPPSYNLSIEGFFRHMRSFSFQPPTLDEEKWSAEFCHFVKLCLTEDPEQRPSAEELLLHPFITQSGLSEDLMLDRLNQRQHAVEDQGHLIPAAAQLPSQPVSSAASDDIEPELQSLRGSDTEPRSPEPSDPAAVSDGARMSAGSLPRPVSPLHLPDRRGTAPVRGNRVRRFFCRLPQAFHRLPRALRRCFSRFSCTSCGCSDN
ncbi:mitogen-activated protein kinase kinase kinase kinase 3-like [Denticeps clupeoides]|uniref:mitogen-activated protein kinase kinase kinase kinase 3-like n=1 Tax=Denticeps clupeoides TaxID=299321 RepID=UPI0010A3C053|nr:mitogen-activated protein kinase kinase kinase kinase 3-like [Denticeps clupeoides]